MTDRMTPLLDQIRQELGPMSSKAKARKLLKIMLEGVREFVPVVRDHEGFPAHQLVGSPEDIWRAMIDAALAQLTEEEVG